MLNNAFINLIYNSDLFYVVTSPRTQKNINFLTIGMAPFPKLRVFNLYMKVIPTKVVLWASQQQELYNWQQ